MNEIKWEALAEVRTSFLEALDKAIGSKDEAELQKIRSSFFGPKGQLKQLLRSVGKLPAEQRREAGQEANRVREALEAKLSDALAALEAQKRHDELHGDRVDTTMPGRHLQPYGAIHPINRIVSELTNIFARMGFEVAEGPEVELDWYNFTALNFPPDHPARDMQDTFFARPPDDKGIQDLVLRTHTSPVQIRAMEKTGAPIRIISPGRVYRCDSDASHSPMFHQIEGLWVDEGVSFAHLKGVLTSFINVLFGERPVRFRPSFFPFVEPGAEVDIQCAVCDGAGCRVCKQSGWMEILGAGMVHPAVLEACNIDPEKYTGFAFGLGVDRVAMLRWSIDDLAHLFRGDMRFLEQL
ncbi:MAG: phenylalanine--tRNA ligase subunit alpha [Myxococcota bacterium]|nr:phenylalanine--tRNA ligase subunit alpha [Myxococcota bacterium]